MAYRVLYAKQFHDQLTALDDYDYERIESSIDVIAENPDLVRDYDPYYPASLPPIDLKWYYVPKTYKVIYLTVDRAKKLLQCYYLADTRMDPLHRFDDLDA